MRFLAVFIFLAIAFLIPFLIWGERFEFTPDGAVSWLRSYGDWAWAVAILLLSADLILPLPATAVMSGLGFVYGPYLGGLIGAAGSFLSGCIAFGLCRRLGRGVALKLVGERDLARGEKLFRDFGGWLVTLSRWMPLLPEVIACMAGLVRMPWSTFSLALACGSVPMGFTYAAIGHAGVDHPTISIAVSAVLPPILWFVIQRYLRKIDD